MEAYGYKQHNITDLNSIDRHSSNFYNYKGLNFLSKLKSINTNILIIFHGAVPIHERIVFRGYDFIIPNTDIVCVSDFLLDKYSGTHCYWTLSTKKIPHADHIYKEVFSHLIKMKNYKNIIFTGTSAGGFPSSKFACIFNSTALISNPQLYLEKYVNGFSNLKNIVEKEDDELIYTHMEIENIINNNKPKQIIIYNNQNDSNTYKYHIMPFVKFIEDKNINHLFKFCIFDYKGDIPKGKTHHCIRFPDNKKHVDVLCDFLSDKNPQLENHTNTPSKLKKPIKNTHKPVDLLCSLKFKRI